MLRAVAVSMALFSGQSSPLSPPSPAPQPLPASQNLQLPSEPPADSTVSRALKSRNMTAATWMNPVRLVGDFDGNGKPDVALLVAHAQSGKRGILIVHGGRTLVSVIGAGINFGNGGDDFEWANRWTVTKRKGKPDALLVEREESGGGIVEFVGGKYRWRQQGD